MKNGELDLADCSEPAAPNDGPAALPSLTDLLSQWLGFQVHLPALPQTIRNLDKAISRVIGAGGENLAARLERNTARIGARASAEVAAIDEGRRLLLRKLGEEGELVDRALEYAYGESVLRQRNRETIARLAVEHLSADIKGSAQNEQVEDIDDDWLNAFADLAGGKSKSEIQDLWSRILAGKIRKPKEFSLKSLTQLAALDVSDANLLHEILGYAINQDFIYSEKFEDITKFLKAEELGALNGTSGLTRTFNRHPGLPSSEPMRVSFTLGGCLYLYESAGNALMLQSFSLTRFGKDLLSIAGELTTDSEYRQRFEDYLKGEGKLKKCVLSTQTGAVAEFVDL